MREEIDCIGVEIDGRVIYKTQSMQLKTKRTLTNDELSSVRSVQTVYTISPSNAILYFEIIRSK